MNDISALALSENTFRQEKVPFKEIPSQSKLFVDYLNDSDNVFSFYPSKNKNLKDYADEVLANYEIDRQQLTDILREEHQKLGAGEKTFANIDKLRDADCVTVIAGQQAGLFSGAMYTIYKALSAIKLAEELNQQGIKAVPMFWIASEDHDFEEANKTFVLDQQNHLEVITNNAHKVEENTPVAYIYLGHHIQETIENYFQNLPKTEFTDSTKKLLESLYQEGETYSSAFAKMILKLFGEYGLILVCPMSRGLRRLSSPIFAKAIEEHEGITAALLKRDEELKEKGYHSQVFVTEDFFPFFYVDEHIKRNALRFDKDSDTIHSLYTEDTFTKDELIKIARESPAQLSPNVLMRSVAQDYLFPTICYYGGSAEIAYFAQNEVIYKLLNRPVTHFRHRSSFTIVDPKSGRTLEKYDLSFQDMFRKQEDLLAEVIDKFVASKTAETFTDVEDKINSELSRLEKELINTEPTLADNLANRRKKILWHISTLKSKFHHAETFKNQVLCSRIEHMTGSLYPRHSLQERTMNVIFYLNMFGDNFIKWLYQSIELDEKGHQVLFL